MLVGLGPKAFVVTGNIPFASPYRPVWLGLGAVAFDLLLAVVVTSVLRARIGVRAWRTVHWLAYASWPLALVHSLTVVENLALGRGFSTGTGGRILWKVERRNAAEITIFKSLGMAVEDVAAARLAFERASERGLGRGVVI